MTWNKTDDSAVSPEEPVSSWLAGRLIENTDELTREILTWYGSVTPPQDRFNSDGYWVGSYNEMVLPAVVPLMAEGTTGRVRVRAFTRKALANVEVSLGYGLSQGRSVQWTPYQTFNSTSTQELIYTLDLTDAHLDALNELPVLLKFKSLESTDPADIDINGGFVVDGITGQQVTKPFWTNITDETALAGYNRDDLFSYYYSGTTPDGKPADANWSDPRPQIFYRGDGVGNTAFLYTWPRQNVDPIQGYQAGLQNIHLTLLGQIRIVSIDVEQICPLSLLPYPGQEVTPLSNLDGALQSVAPDLPTRYQPDLLTYRAQKYLYTRRPPIQSLGPGSYQAYFPEMVSTGTLGVPVELMRLPLQQDPTQVDYGSFAKRDAWRLVLWVAAWTRSRDAGGIDTSVTLSLLESNKAEFGTPVTSPSFVTHHSVTTEVAIPYMQDPDSLHFRVKGFQGATLNNVRNIVGHVALSPLWTDWREASRNLVRLELTIKDPVPGNIHEYLSVEFALTGNSAGEPNKTLIQATAWYLTPIPGETWEATTEPIP